jgi:GT2 family glycosyltransferase
MELTFDIVVPTTRLVPETIGPLLRVHESAPEAHVTYYLVIDRPNADLDGLRELVRGRHDVRLIRNEVSLGAHGTRNRGIDAGHSEFILFLDDDVFPSPVLLCQYVAIIATARSSPGFVGVTRFPAACDHFSGGILASDILTFFGLAATARQLPWGVTANLCLRRSALGDLRFSTEFPKAGGGEDIDLCLRLIERAGQRLIAVPGAVVEHPWWANGRRSYGRFFRWAFGDSRLPALHPQHRYRNAPTLPESLLLIFAVWLLVPSFPGLVALAAFPVGFGVEIGVDYGKIRYRGSRIPVRVAVESTMIRLANDLGRLAGNLSRGRAWALLERFDYFCDGIHVRHERHVAVTKFVVSAGLLTLIWCLAP